MGNFEVAYLLVGGSPIKFFTMRQSYQQHRVRLGNITLSQHYMVELCRSNGRIPALQTNMVPGLNPALVNFF